MWIERDIKNKIQRAAGTRPVVLLTGARQTGKSSLLQREFNKAEYITFDSIDYARSADESPSFFLEQFNNTEQVIIDEVQYVPGIFRQLKILVDRERRKYGKWILTGSQQFELMENISETLAGRIGVMRLETLSASELRKGPVGYNREFIYKGGYPELWSNPGLNSDDFFESYVRTYIERDLRNIIQVKNLSDFQRFIKLLAARSGQLINYSVIASDTGVSDVTIRKWVQAMQLSGIIYLLPPFHTNMGKRLVKSPKVYFADHGLLCWLLGITGLDDWADHVYRGNIWENIVFMELVKTQGLRPGADIFFYRDQNGVEIDFVTECSNTLSLIEAKAAERVEPGKLNFKKVSQLFAGKKKVRSFLMNNSQEKKILKFGNYYAINPLLTDFDLAGKNLD